MGPWVLAESVAVSALLRSYSSLMTASHVPRAKQIVHPVTRSFSVLQVLRLTPLADAQIPAASWAIASVYAPAALRDRWQDRSLVSLRRLSASQPTESDPAQQQVAAQSPAAEASNPSLLPGAGDMVAASATVAAAQAERPDQHMQVGSVQHIDRVALWPQSPCRHTFDSHMNAKRLHCQYLICIDLWYRLAWRR